VRFSVDSNVLVYAFLLEDKRKHTIASELMIRAMLLDCVLPAQVLGEFLNVVRRKKPSAFGEAQAQVQRWVDTIQIVETGTAQIIAGARLASKHKLQLWDGIIWQVARSAHAVLFLTEDLQDHVTIEGMKALNPFQPENDAELQALLRSADLEIDWPDDCR
jgi:predicted nucleic acid-binding protein